MGQRQPSIAELGRSLFERGQINRHRYCLILSGEECWGLEAAGTLLCHYPQQGVLYLGAVDHALYPTIPIGDARRVLGNEYHSVLCNAYAGFDPDAIGIVSGCIMAGGFLVLITPSLSDWPSLNDPQYSRMAIHGRTAKFAGNYISYLIKVITQDPRCILIEQNQERHEYVLPEIVHSQAPCFKDQQAAVSAVVKVVTGQRRRPAILLSDRGRGKSTALGMAARQLLQQQCKRIVVTGHSRQSVSHVFRHAGIRIGPDAGKLEYVPVDRLVSDKQVMDLLLVDEAAAIPLSQLIKLLIQYPRIAFASTVHGYEGTGRSFVLRFSDILDKHTRGRKYCRLKEPIRSASNDPLEGFIFRLLALDCEPAIPLCHQMRLGQCRVDRLEPCHIAKNEGLLREIFGLLTLAHYRTRPNDLRVLLDAQNLSVFCLFCQQALIGVALISHEGDIESELAKKIWSGQTRPKGHLLPEVFLAQLGLLSSGKMHMARIVRIVIHPQLQGQGAGTWLLRHLVRHYEEKTDVIGSSFGASPALLRFWERSGFKTIRLGLTASRQTATHSCVVARGSSNGGMQLIKQANRKLRTNLPHQLKTIFKDVEPELVLALYMTLSIAIRMNDDELRDLIAFAHGKRNPDNMPHALVRLCEIALAHPRPEIPVQAKLVLIGTILQGRHWNEWPQTRTSDRQWVRTAVRRMIEIFFPLKTKNLRHQVGL